MVNKLSYLTNKRIVINDEFCQFIKIINIKFVEMEGSYVSFALYFIIDIFFMQKIMNAIYVKWSFSQKKENQQLIYILL